MQNQIKKLSLAVAATCAAVSGTVAAKDNKEKDKWTNVIFSGEVAGVVGFKTNKDNAKINFGGQISIGISFQPQQDYKWQGAKQVKVGDTTIEVPDLKLRQPITVVVDAAPRIYFLKDSKLYIAPGLRIEWTKYKPQKDNDNSDSKRYTNYFNFGLTFEAGYCINKYVEVFGKIGYMFPAKPSTSENMKDGGFDMKDLKHSKFFFLVGVQGQYAHKSGFYVGGRLSIGVQRQALIIKSDSKQTITPNPVNEQNNNDDDENML